VRPGPVLDAKSHRVERFGAFRRAAPVPSVQRRRARAARVQPDLHASLRRAAAEPCLLQTRVVGARRRSTDVGGGAQDAHHPFGLVEQRRARRAALHGALVPIRDREKLAAPTAKPGHGIVLEADRLHVSPGVVYADGGCGRGPVAAPTRQVHVVLGPGRIVQLKQGEVALDVPYPLVGAGLEVRLAPAAPVAALRALVVPVDDDTGCPQREAVLHRSEEGQPNAGRIVQQDSRANKRSPHLQEPDAPRLVPVLVRVGTRHVDVTTRMAGRDDPLGREVPEAPVDRAEPKIELPPALRRNRGLDDDLAALENRSPQLAVRLVVRFRERTDDLLHLAAPHRVHPEPAARRHEVAGEAQVQRHRTRRRRAQPPDRRLAVRRRLPAAVSRRRGLDLERVGEAVRLAGGRRVAGRFRRRRLVRQDRRGDGRRPQHRNIPERPKRGRSARRGRIVPRLDRDLPASRGGAGDARQRDDQPQRQEISKRPSESRTHAVTDASTGSRFGDPALTCSPAQ